MKRFLALAVLFLSATLSYGEYFSIKNFNIHVKVQKDGVLDITERIAVAFTEPRHGIFRDIPYGYIITKAEGSESAEYPLLFGDRYQDLLYDISVQNFHYQVEKNSSMVRIRIGSKNAYVEGDQVYIINYKVYGEVRRFSDYSVIYWNLTGNEWPVDIDYAVFSMELPSSIPLNSTDYKIYSGAYGSKDNDACYYKYEDGELSGRTIRALNPNEGITAWIKLPRDYFVKNTVLEKLLWLQNNSGLFAVIIPFIVLILAFLVWNKYGRDVKIVKMVQFKPPEDMTPAEAGVIIDDVTDNRDVLCLIYYWAAAGYLEIEELEKGTIFKSKDFKLIKKKDLPDTAKEYEKTMFNGLFGGNETEVLISSLKDTFYTTFDSVKSRLNDYIGSQAFYTPGSRGLRALFIFLGMVFAAGGFFLTFFADWSGLYIPSGIVSAVILIIFGALMPKKTAKGLEKYKVLQGFKLFVEKAEKPKLEVLMKEDPNYFDRTLSYAIAFGLGDKWAAKFEGIIKEPPSWYHGRTAGMFTTAYFVNSLHSSISDMSATMTSRPSSSGSSGGGGGFSGGGGGGGGGGSW